MSYQPPHPPQIHMNSKNYSYITPSLYNLGTYIFSFFFGCLAAYRVPGPDQIQAEVVTYTTAAAVTDP